MVGGVPPTPSIAPEHLYLLFWKSFRAVEEHDRRSIQALGFPALTDFAVLEVLRAKGPLPVNTIGRRVMLTSGSITTAVDRAEHRGWVKRVPCPEDRRVIHVHLTGAGRRVIDAAVKVHFRRLAEAFAVLSPAEQQTFADLLRKVGHHAAALTGAVPASDDLGPAEKADR
jgi:MarR family 2-MHQ and catechol resistance regulon transcriptional repressor